MLSGLDIHHLLHRLWASLIPKSVDIQLAQWAQLGRQCERNTNPLGIRKLPRRIVVIFATHREQSQQNNAIRSTCTVFKTSRSNNTTRRQLPVTIHLFVWLFQACLVVYLAQIAYCFFSIFFNSVPKTDTKVTPTTTRNKG